MCVCVCVHVCVCLYGCACGGGCVHIRGAANEMLTTEMRKFDLGRGLEPRTSETPQKHRFGALTSELSEILEIVMRSAFFISLMSNHKALAMCVF